MPGLFGCDLGGTAPNRRMAVGGLSPRFKPEMSCEGLRWDKAHLSQSDWWALLPLVLIVRAFSPCCYPARRAAKMDTHVLPPTFYEIKLFCKGYW